jgi:gentisate 1,2-dioxygenase
MANAMRFILESGPDVYIAVEDKKVPMLAGDVVLTPNRSWHGPRNDGDHDTYWIDFLDAPLADVLGPMFFERYDDEFVQMVYSTANCCYAVQKRSGKISCEGQVFESFRGDVFVIPSWRQTQWWASEEAYRLRVTDQNLLEKLNWLHTTAPGAVMDKSGSWDTGPF